MNRDTLDPRIIITPAGTYCLYDERGRLVGTIAQPVERQPVGPGREKVFLTRASLASANAA